MVTHTTFVGRVVAPSCAVALVIASAGFGAVYAAKVGSQHGVLLALLSVTMALALEGIKPLAIAASLQAFSKLSVVRGVLLLLLGLVAVAYSLTAELAMMASTRGDLIATRSQAVDQLLLSRERYDRAKEELANLKPTRTPAELEALASICKGPCAGLHAELGRAKRRQELESVMLVASGSIMTSPAIQSADPGSTALATYLAAL